MGVKIIVFEMNDELMRVRLEGVATLTTGRMRSGRGLTTTTREPSRLSKLTPSLSSLLMRTRVPTPYFLMCVRSWSREKEEAQFSMNLCYCCQIHIYQCK